MYSLSQLNNAQARSLDIHKVVFHAWVAHPPAHVRVDTQGNGFDEKSAVEWRSLYVYRL